MSLLWHLGNHCWSLAGVCCHALSPTQVIGWVPLPHPGDHSSSPVRLRCSSWRPAAAGRPGPKTCSTRTCSLHLLLTPVPQIWSLDILARAAPQSWLHRPVLHTCSTYLVLRTAPQTGFPEVVPRLVSQKWSADLLPRSVLQFCSHKPGIQTCSSHLVSSSTPKIWSPELVHRRGPHSWCPDMVPESGPQTCTPESWSPDPVIRVGAQGCSSELVPRTDS